MDRNLRTFKARLIAKVSTHGIDHAELLFSQVSMIISNTFLFPIPPLYDYEIR